MEKVLVSACLLGLNVRYNGKIKSLRDTTLSNWRNQNRLIVVCPEVAGGLSTPRPPAEIQPDTKLIITTTGDNVTDAFERGAQHALHLCQRHQIKYALLKESSPSCGSQTIYDGSFSNTKVNGLGRTAALLSENGIKVFSEENIAKLIVEVEQLDQAIAT